MAALWVLVTFTVAAVFAFQNSIGFAVTFLGTCWLPCFVVGTAKWGLMRGDRSQKVVVPIIAAVVLAFAYWLSTKVEVHISGYLISGFVLWIVSALIGLTVPLSMGPNPVKST